jgi:hypothetical protein
MVAFGPSVERIGLVIAIAVVLAIGVRHGFALRAPEPRASALHWRLACIVAISVLITCEAWEFVDRSTTVTSLVVPLLAIPVVRVLALTMWARLGWALLS